MYISRVHILKSKRSFHAKSSIYYFHMKTKILADFQICISASLRLKEFMKVFPYFVCELQQKEIGLMYSKVTSNMYSVKKVF